MRYSILHLSDLHRDVSDEVGNPALIESISRDLHRFHEEHPDSKYPTLCIVTGDLVYGVKPDSASASAELARQYKQSEDFLITLCEECFDGDCERVIILPGNHDVSYATVMSSLERVPAPATREDRAALVRELFQPQSSLRWSWPELSFFRIADQAAYNSRLSNYADIQSRFYKNARSFDVSSNTHLQLFDYQHLNLTVVALNSCYRNDPLNRKGAIHPDSLAELSKLLRKGNYSGRLIAVAWHHNISGGPAQDDYMDSEVLQQLLDWGVSLGFHGHRHSSLCVTERYRLGDPDRKITIIGAGTLCAGPAYLNAGEPRRYNIIELDTDTLIGRTYKRDMLNQAFTQPLWGRGTFAGGTDVLTFPISPPLRNRPVNLDVDLDLERASQLLATKQWKELLALSHSIKADSRALPFLRRSLSELNDASLTVEMLWPPNTYEECVMVGGAILELRDKSRASAFLRLDSVTGASDASVRDIVQRITSKLK